VLIKINEITFDYRDQGAGQALIFLHAFPLNQNMWNDQTTELGNQYRTITLDLRGFGGSDAPQGPYLMDQMAADVRGLMTALNIEQAVLVGLSMGGYISLAFLRNYPDAILAMVLADTRAGADTPEARGRRLKSAEKAETEGAAAIAAEVVPALLGATSLQSRPGVVERVREMVEVNSPVGIAGAQRGMAERVDSTTVVADIDFPVMVIVGAEDTLTPVAEAEKLRDRIPGARLAIIEQAGHLSNIEQPDEFNTVLRQFIDSLNISGKANNH